MVVVPMVPTVLVVVPSGGWSIHSSSWREFLDLHEDFGLESIQESIIVEPRRGRLRRASNLSRAVVTWRLFPFSLLLLPFFFLSLIRKVERRDLSGQQGLLDIRILLHTRENILEKLMENFFSRLKKIWRA